MSLAAKVHTMYHKAGGGRDQYFIRNCSVFPREISHLTMLLFHLFGHIAQIQDDRHLYYKSNSYK